MTLSLTFLENRLISLLIIEDPPLIGGFGFVLKERSIYQSGTLKFGTMKIF